MTKIIAEKGTDAEIVTSVLKGNKDDFALIVQRYQSKIAALAYRMGVESSGIEDVVSEIFLKTYKNLNQYRSEFAFTTWLYRISTNHIIDHTRKKREFATPETEWPSDHDTFQNHSSMERAGHVREAVARLPAKYRKVLSLRYLEEREVKEIASILEIKEATVKIRLMRGRQKLRDAIITNFPHLAEE